MHLYEQNAFRDAPIIDRENGVIRHVKILGTKSKNGRSYSKAAVHNASGIYEGMAVNINHLRDEPESERKCEDGFGQLKNILVENDELYGDLIFLKTHPIADRVCEAAERMPEAFGLSHNATGTMNGSVVESIDHVFSVDLVRYPATVNSLFESRDPKPEPKWLVAIKEAIAEGIDAATMRTELDALLPRTEEPKVQPESKTPLKEVVAPPTEPKPAVEPPKTPASTPDETLLAVQKALEGVTSKLDSLSKTVLLERVLREQRLDRTKLDPAQLSAIEGKDTYDDMVAEAEKLPAYFRESVRILDAPLRESAADSYDALKKELELV